MSNSLNISLKGKTVLVKEEWFENKPAEPLRMYFVCDGGKAHFYNQIIISESIKFPIGKFNINP